MYGKRDCIELFEDDSMHMYTRPMAEKAAEFFSLHLLGYKVTPEDARIKDIEPSRLWCTKSGQVRGELEGARFLQEENVDSLINIQDRLKLLPETERKEKAYKWLNDKVFCNRKPRALNPRIYSYGMLDELDFKAYVWWSQEGIFNHLFIFRHFRNIDSELPVTIALWDGGTACLEPHMDWIHSTCNSGRAVAILDVSGTGNILPGQLLKGHPVHDFYGTIYKFTCDLIWLDDSLAAMRVYDVIRALDFISGLKGIGNEGHELYAYGRHGMYARLAAFLDSRVAKIMVENSVKSMADIVKASYFNSTDIYSILLPGMLKYFDLPDIDRWNADRWI